jgi:hypothetical protein
MGHAAASAAVASQASQPTSTVGTTSTGSATAATGTGGISAQAGIGCPSGTVWNAASPWLGCAAPVVNCTATTATSGGCTYSVPATASGSSVSVSPSGTGYSGTYTATCSNGGWSNVSASCTPPSCTGGTATSGACSYTLATTASGASTTVATSTSGYTGSLSASCSAGTWSNSSVSCVANSCDATTLSWTVTGNTCSGPITSAVSGGSLTITNTDTNYATTSSATFACSAGTWGSATSATCAGGQAATSGTASYSLSPSYEIEWVDYDTDADNATKPSTGCTSTGLQCVYMAAPTALGSPVTVTFTNTSASASVTMTAAPALGTAVTASDVSEFSISSNTCTTGLVLGAGKTCTTVVTRATAYSCKSYGAHLIFTSSAGSSYIILDKTFLSSSTSCKTGTSTKIQ